MTNQNHGFHGGSMGDAFYFLDNDWAFVQIAGHIVSGGADDLYAALVGLLIWTSAFEARQERMVDVDRPAIQGTA
ncbi:hypothetical protein D3C80_1297320 [compost metagenome]